MEAAEINVVLDRLAQRFENAEQPAEGVPTACGWGQFLDDPKAHRQTGPYGTSAGLIVSALAGRGTAALQRVAPLVTFWWKQWEGGGAEGRRLFCQTPRLAFFYLGLRLSHILDDDGVCAAVREELLRRTLPSGMWGNYWTAANVLDQTPRLFCSSMVVLSLTLLENASPDLLGRLEAAIRAIEDSLIGNKDIPLLHAAAASAAILSVRGGAVSPQVKRRIRHVAWSTRANLGDLGVYFYDYQFATGSGSTEFGRDYFIVPSELLVGIAGLQRGAPVALRERAETAAKALLTSIRTNNGAYRSDPEQRISSKNQAWAALLLYSSIAPPTSSGALARIAYELRKERNGNWFTEVVFPLFSLCAITAEIVLFRDAGALVNVFTGIGGIIIGGLYGSTLLRNLFPGR
jgi:hypothetical protein